MLTVIEQQCFFGALGLYTLRRKDGTLAIDGIAGPATINAIRSFQKSYQKRPDGSTLAIDGRCGPATEKALREVIGNNEKPQATPITDIPEWWSKYAKWCKREDWRCQCNGRYCDGFVKEPHEQTVIWLYDICEHFGKPYVRHSGLRCPQHNANTPNASPNSRHKLGSAFDFHIPGVSHEELYNYASSLIGDHGGVGKYVWGIHIDDRGYRARW